MQVVLSFILCVFIPTCIGRTKLANCSKNPYQEHICAVYNCTKLEELTKTESSVEPDTSVCLILRNESDYEGLEIFPNRFEEDETRSTLLRHFSKRHKFEMCFSSKNGYQLGNGNNDIERKEKICTVKKYKLNKGVRQFQMISTFVSPFFIFFTIGVFVMTYAIQNVHGWIHFTNGCCVFALYISWGLRYLFFRGSMVGTTRCAVFAFMQHYFHLSVFSWLIVACYDLHKLSESHASGNTLNQQRNLLMYIRASAFGWGIPAIYMGICGVISTISIQFGMDRDGMVATYILPEYGKYRCFLAFNAYWIHLILPTLILFIVSLVVNSKTLKVLRKGDSDSKQRAVQKVNLMRNLACLRAMMLTSVCWGCDILRSFMTAYDRHGNLWLRVILDTIIIYQTIPICIIYSCRPHILNHLESKYPFLTGTIATSRTYFCVKLKEVDPSIVTDLRIHRKTSGENLVQIPNNNFQETTT